MQFLRLGMLSSYGACKSFDVGGRPGKHVNAIECSNFQILCGDFDAYGRGVSTRFDYTFESNEIMGTIITCALKIS